nr:hypothetical protein [uncultured Cohaesibacter sp.]
MKHEVASKAPYQCSESFMPTFLLFSKTPKRLLIAGSDQAFLIEFVNSVTFEKSMAVPLLFRLRG